jgi:hypothetical protein
MVKRFIVSAKIVNSYRDIAEVLPVKFYLNIDQRYRDNSFARIPVTRGHPPSLMARPLQFKQILTIDLLILPLNNCYPTK